MLYNVKKFAWIHGLTRIAIYAEKLETKKDSFLKHILTHIVSRLNKMINEIKKYLPSKVNSFLKILLTGEKQPKIASKTFLLMKLHFNITLIAYDPRSGLFVKINTSNCYQ